jgi:undecaprenyl diphosphate synthase
MTNQKSHPQCVGFIMDGNRRWATDQGLATLEGHTAGVQVFFETLTWLAECAIPHAVYYAFSSENWRRSSEEVSYLLQLFETSLAEVRSVVVHFIGDRSDFSESLQTQMHALEAKSQVYIGAPTVWIALSYGGRAELVAAANQAVANGVPVDESSFGSLLWSAGMPDPDLIIRTGGAMRLSNFLPWQSVYSELMFTETYWPAFTKEEFTRMLAQYGERTRRFGQ